MRRDFRLRLVVGQVLLNIVNGVLNAANIFGVVIRDFDIELFFRNRFPIAFSVPFLKGQGTLMDLDGLYPDGPMMDRVPYIDFGPRAAFPIFLRMLRMLSSAPSSCSPSACSEMIEKKTCDV